MPSPPEQDPSSEPAPSGGEETNRLLPPIKGKQWSGWGPRPSDAKSSQFNHVLQEAFTERGVTVDKNTDFKSEVTDYQYWDQGSNVTSEFDWKAADQDTYRVVLNAEIAESKNGTFVTVDSELNHGHGNFSDSRHHKTTLDKGDAKELREEMKAIQESGVSKA